MPPSLRSSSSWCCDRGDHKSVICGPSTCRVDVGASPSSAGRLRRRSRNARPMRSGDLGASRVAQWRPSYPLCLSVNRAPVAQWIEQLPSDHPGPSAVARAWDVERRGSSYLLCSISTGCLGLRPGEFLRHRTASRGLTVTAPHPCSADYRESLRWAATPNLDRHERRVVIAVVDFDGARVGQEQRWPVLIGRDGDQPAR